VGHLVAWGFWQRNNYWENRTESSCRNWKTTKAIWKNGHWWFTRSIL